MWRPTIPLLGALECKAFHQNMSSDEARVYSEAAPDRREPSRLRGGRVERLEHEGLGMSLKFWDAFLPFAFMITFAVVLIILGVTGR